MTASDERKREIHVAFCPERIAEGKAIEELTSLPQIISAFEPVALAKARELFSQIAPYLIELEPMEAELQSYSRIVGDISILPPPTNSIC